MKSTSQKKKKSAFIASLQFSSSRCIFISKTLLRTSWCEAWYIRGRWLRCSDCMFQAHKPLQREQSLSAPLCLSWGQPVSCWCCRQSQPFPSSLRPQDQQWCSWGFYSPATVKVIVFYLPNILSVVTDHWPGRRNTSPLPFTLFGNSFIYWCANNHCKHCQLALPHGIS